MELRKLINLFTEQQAFDTGAFENLPPNVSRSKTTGPRQGVVGSELARTSSGQFTSRADRLNQDKVNAALGNNPATGKPYVAGRADTNLALRNLYRQGGPQPAVAPAPVEPSPPPPSASNEKSKETVAAAPKVDAPAADAPAPKAVAYPQPPVADIDSATAAERSGQNIGGQFAKAASDKAAQDSFALVTGMAPKLDARSAVPAAPTADAPAAAPMRTAQDFAGSDTVDPPEQPKGVFSKFMPGQAGADNEAGGVAQSQAQPAAPAKTYGGGYDPNKVQYAVDQPKVPALAPNQIGTGTPGVGLVDRFGDPVTSGANLKRGPMGNIINEVDVEEADPNLPKYNPLAKTAVPNSAPNKQPSMYDIERANKKEIASQFDPKSTYVNPYDKDTKASSPGSKSVNTVADFEESVEQDLEEELAEAFDDMLRLSGLRLNEMSDREADMQRRMAGTRAAAAGVAPGTTQTSTGAGGATMSVTKSGPAGAGSGPATQAAKPTQTPTSAGAGSGPATQAAKPTGGFSATGQSSVDFEESIEEELAEAFNDMLRLSGIQLNEKAPPGAKAERMVKHIKKGYAKDGKLSDKEKSIAFATAWKAKKAGKLDESFHLMLDEGGHTLSHVVNRFKHEVKKFLNGEEMSDNLYDALYDYYLDSGEMPYGVAKAREGDPYSWISDRFYNDIEGIVNVKQPVDEVAHSTAMKDLDRLATLAGLTTEGATDAGLPMPLSMPPLEKKQLIPSMSESVRSLEECGDMGMDQDNSMDQESVFSVNTNMTSNGKKDVTVTASGDRAEELLAMLKLAGMERHSTRRPSALFVSGDEEMMEREVTPVPDDGNKLGGMGDFEQIDAIDEAKKTRITRHANTPDEEYQTVASITRQGNDLNREKKQFAGKPRLGDNPMAEGQMEFDRELVDLLDSVLIKKDVDENSNTPNPYPVGQDALSPQEKLNPTNNPNKSIVRGILDFVTKPTKPGM